MFTHSTQTTNYLKLNWFNLLRHGCNALNYKESTFLHLTIVSVISMLSEPLKICSVIVGYFAILLLCIKSACVMRTTRERTECGILHYIYFVVNDSHYSAIGHPDDGKISCGTRS